MEPDVLVEAVGGVAETGVNYVKVGLFPGAKRADCVRALSSVARKTKLVGMMFADQGADDSLLPLMAESGFAGAMLDTAYKNGSRLLDHRDIPSLGAFVDACRTYGLLSGIAGSLEPPDVPRLLVIAPDVLGFRGALCAGRDREGQIDPESVRVVRELIPMDPRGAEHGDGLTSAASYRLLAARGYSADPERNAPQTDRIFVRDFVLPVRVGVYDREHKQPQNVRFNVDVCVRRSGHTAEDMRDVLSYDVVTDAIRMVAAQGHIALIEGFAERVAISVLAHPQVMSVTVRVEKLEVGPGAVGVEIVRERPVDVAKVHHLFPAAARQPYPKAAE
jgi:dihydroneopterin aldolase